MNNEIIKKLDRCLLSGQSILFTGAGFSLGAKNGQDYTIPTGNQLKEIILSRLLNYDDNDPEYNELVANSLHDICTFAESQVSRAKVQDFIISIFQDCKPLPFQRIIASFKKWKKVYTINIDDLFENAAPAGRYVVQNIERPISFTKAKQIEYIKLHGCVRNRSGRIVFSNQDYIDSMLKSRDYRFNSFAQDMITENFVFIGTEMNEFNLDYYINLFSEVSNNTSHGQLFFINPKPSLIFETKVQRIGASIIKWTTEQFSNHLNNISESVSTHSSSHAIEDFLYLKERFDLDKNFKGYKSYLYFGQHPDYRDIIFDWDFINPLIEQLHENITKHFNSGSNKRLMVSIFGKSLSGKSVYLKRLGIALTLDNYAVYEFTGRRFDIQNFALKARNLPEKNIALLFDNASFYYPVLKNLVTIFPPEKNLLVITTARTYAHNRKRYCLVSETWFKELVITGETRYTDNIFANNIALRLDEKGLLGHLKAKTFDERVSYISKTNDIESCLFSITNGSYFQKRQLKHFYKKKNIIGANYIDLLSLLAILNKLDISYLPISVISLLYGGNYSKAINICDDFIKYYKDVDGYAIRDTFLISHLLKDLRPKDKIRLLKELLICISPQVVDSNHTYWNELASVLMKGKLLRSVLRMRNNDVKNLLTDIKQYYNDDYNYWLQVGITEQHDSEYELALNHFRQAESMSPNSYIVRNAIARNFLRQANEIGDFEVGINVHKKGVSLMMSLINDCEEFQVKAYSTHCLLFETIRFYRRNSIVPKESEIKEMYTMLRMVMDKDPDGPMSKHISNVFFRFLQDNNLTYCLPKMSLHDLKYLRFTIGPDENLKDITEDFEL